MQYFLTHNILQPGPCSRLLSRAHAGGSRVPRGRSGADDVPRPRLVLGARGQVSDHHLHCLQLLVLGRDGAHLVGDLVACHGNVLAFNAVEGSSS